MITTQAPQRFGRYVLLDRMGVGGMAEVFRAVVPGAEGFRRDLVVKRILADRACATNFIEMFVHEARISALLHHPNVVQVFDFGQVDGSYFLAMELLRGRDLLAIFRSLRERQRHFPIPIAAHVAQQVALGLGYAHALTSPDGQPLNIIHRDVSPSNIMCLRTGGVKLLDFGIAQAIGETDSDESDRSSFKGKLSYMAPERLRDGPQDSRVDLFALGAVLWEMLTARRLFSGKTEVDKLASVLEKPIPPPSALRPDVPPALDQIVLKALARDPDQRYATGQEMADDLEEVVGALKYQSRMLPALLSDLFGSAPSSAHIALSMAAPELFAFDPIVTPSTTASLLPVRSQPEGPLDRGRSVTLGALARWGTLGRGTKAAIGAGALALIGIVAVTTTRAPNIQSVPTPAAVLTASRTPSSASGSASPGQIFPLAVPSPMTAPATPAANMVELPVLPPLATATTAGTSHPPSAAVPSPTAPTRLAMRSTTPVRKVAPRPIRPSGTKPANKLASGRITRGLSIDPFAEAAVRGGRR